MRIFAFINLNRPETCFFIHSPKFCYMKKVLLFVSLVISAVGFGQSKVNFGIDGSVAGIKDTVDKVFISYRVNDARITDSSVIKNGKFSFSGSVAEPVKAMLYIKYATNNPALKSLDQDRDMVNVFIQPESKVALTCLRDSFVNAVVKGGAMNIEQQKVEAGEKKFNVQFGPLYKAYSEARKNKDKLLADSLERKIDDLDSTETEDVYGTYIKAHPTSPIALFVLQQYAGYMINADKIGPMYDKLPVVQKNYAEGKKFKAQIDIAAKTGIGKPAMGFVQNDTLGNPVSLASFKGKYVLLDFWASWCGPCRRENPNVVVAFNKYKDKGFTILSVSLDQPGAKDKWLKAIHDDNLTWTHVSDLKFWDNEVAKEYGIQAIPQNFLIDPTGKIIGKDLRGEDLEKKLAGIFTN